MSTVFTEPRKLYELLPAVYRERDAREGFPLRALLEIVEQQAEVLHGDIQGLWDDFFVETCAPWVVPYIGDLVSNDPLFDASRVLHSGTAEALFEDLRGPDLRPELALRNRADVAKTIYYRRRKGTPPMLEELARDVTGWAGHVVEFFRLLDWTQNLNHLRDAAVDCVDLRSVEAVGRVNGAFDTWTHTVDVRAPEQLEGWHNIPNIGFFLWRLRSYPLRDVTPRRGAVDWQFHFSPLGNPAPLFNAWRREGDETGLAGEFHVPGPLRPAFFYEDLRAHRFLAPTRPPYTPLYAPFDRDGSLHVARNGVSVEVAQDPAATVDAYAPRVVCRRLDPWPAVQPSGPVIAVDVASGRLAVGDGWPDATERLDVEYHYGFPADMGGGPYERGKWLVDPSLALMRLEVQQENTPVGAFSTLQDALDHWAAQLRPNAIITVLDNRSYAEPLSIELADERWLVIQAGNGVRPHVRPGGGVLAVTGDHPESTLTLSGLLVEGAVHVTGDTGRLRLLHTTLVPGLGLEESGAPASTDPSVVVTAQAGGLNINTDFRLEVAFSVTGPLRVPAHAAGMWVLDSIVDGLGGSAVAATGTTDQPGPEAVLERTTLLGESFFRALPLASEVIFSGTVESEQRHAGCVRFSFVPVGSHTPRRYRCQPDWAEQQAVSKAEDAAAAVGGTLDPTDEAALREAIRARLVPSFGAEHYGLPDYGQLRLSCPVEVRTGAEDGSEMGAYCHLKQPQREANLRLRLEEYLPFGLVPGIVYVT